jgi:hypothetical protein
MAGVYTYIRLWCNFVFKVGSLLLLGLRDPLTPHGNAGGFFYARDFSKFFKKFLAGVYFYTGGGSLDFGVAVELSKFLQTGGSGCGTVFYLASAFVLYTAWWGYGGVPPYPFDLPPDPRMLYWKC